MTSTWITSALFTYNTNTHALIVPTFNIDPPEKNVTEPEGMVEICITTNSELGREITVTAETGVKSGASYDATG